MKETAIDLCQDEVQKFTNFSGEKIFVAKRQHPIVLFTPILLTLLLLVVIILLLYFVTTQLFQSLILFIGLSLLIVVIAINLLTKFITDYFFHFYIISNRKILELSVVPLFRDKINDVLLDQVRITEIEVKMPSLIHEIFDMGDVIIEFDRPSHLELFTLNNIKDPRTTGNILSRELTSIMHDSPVWFYPRGQNNTPKFYEDIYGDKDTGDKE